MLLSANSKPDTNHYKQDKLKHYKQNNTNTTNIKIDRYHDLLVNLTN